MFHKGGRAEVIRYITEHYGQCQLEECLCLRPGAIWLGTACPSWRPLAGAALERMLQMMNGQSQGQ